MGGEKVQLKQPLDFFMMTDHTAMMGTAPMMLEKGSALYSGTRLDVPDLVRD